ncbi:ATP-binding protein [Campylobacter sp. RM9344]|uniref:ATP-binding protein n=1 Tax=Campylobacter californiensis TaxID=1032243 RepID=A0AAW3ZRD5_9BACT|nr:MULTISPECIES: ATP-binding protein [unclassified Campylobacter]MBE2983934.1 ATP-binding protein [Campylobacter sp. RM6883]MBE2986096.1 ATP-binding protein [Campylobacter sp. RM12919]MBE2987509.1 ATP-binding protein [Campylobacter sp. RM12920]MBE2994472.1 ATP-binding protein [Campylobacter sp. RM6913]MBE3028780.1 ATP-binding protein [Campylobacter sp. RM9344]
MINWENVLATVFRERKNELVAVSDIDFVDINSLLGIETQKEQLLENTQKFIDSKEANHVLLWGERGCGKSSLVKAVFTKFYTKGLRVIEIGCDDLRFLPEIIDEIRKSEFKFIIFCDDMSFEDGSKEYKFLKPIMEGSIQKPPKNVLIYATSNRRHLLSEYKSDNVSTLVSQDEIHYSDATQEKISLSDRFGLWISFYQGSFNDYLKIVDFYFKDYTGDKEKLHELAKNYATLRASRSGRTAKQFYIAFKDSFK